MATRTDRPNLVATGVVLIAASILSLAGFVQLVDAVIAFSNDIVLTEVGGYVFGWDATVWGTIHLLLGVAFIVTGVGIMVGQGWARGIGVGLAVLSAVVQFVWLPFYPIAAVVMIALNVLIIWALANYTVPEQ